MYKIETPFLTHKTFWLLHSVILLAFAFLYHSLLLDSAQCLCAPAGANICPWFMLLGKILFLVGITSLLLRALWLSRVQIHSHPADPDTQAPPLSQSESLLLNTLQAIPDTILIVDRDFNVVRSNLPPGEEMTCSCCQDPGACTRQCMGTEPRCVYCPAHDVIEKKRNIETEFRDPKTDRTLEIRAFPIFNSQNTVEYVVLFIRDVTQRKQLQEAFFTFRFAVNAAADGILVIDPLQMRFFDINDTACAQFGYSRQAMLRKGPQDLFPAMSESEWRHYLDSLLDTEESETRMVAEFIRADSSTFPVEARFSLVRRYPTPLAIVIIRDITERKTQEAERERLIEALETRNAEMEQFTYTVSHDLRSPIITIQGFTGLVHKAISNGAPEQALSRLARITAAADKMQELLDDLLELSRIGRIVNPPEAVALEEIVDDTLELLHGPLRKHKIQITVDPALPVVVVDALRIREALQNLIENAIKFMGEQAEPHIEIGCRPPDDNKDSYTVLFVRDNGIGIDPAYHSRVFGLFNQLDNQASGTGIGLALVKRIIEVHGGEIWLESEGCGHGTTFFLSLPRSHPKTSDNPAP